jgi:glucose-6-phosphate 1-epimerase
MTPSQLNKLHGVPRVVAFEKGPGGLPRVVLTGRGGRAAMMLHGAHVTEFVPAGQQPVLWMSQQSWFERGKPIRGGVPVCWPWFSGDGPAPECPGHGFARLLEWHVESAAVLPDGRATITLTLSPADLDGRMKAWWPHAFELRYSVTVGRELVLALETANPGPAPFTITEALHSYFAVSAVGNIRIRGLEEAEYLDTVGTPTRRQDDQPVTITAETDRDYLDTTAECVLEDSAWGRRIIIAKSGSRSTVVWNPWMAKAARMPDFGDNEWPEMTCIESANIRAENAVTLSPGRRHLLQARISVRA